MEMISEDNYYNYGNNIINQDIYNIDIYGYRMQVMIVDIDSSDRIVAIISRL